MLCASCFVKYSGVPCLAARAFFISGMQAMNLASPAVAGFDATCNRAGYGPPHHAPRVLFREAMLGHISPNESAGVISIEVQAGAFLLANAMSIVSPLHSRTKNL